MSNNAITPGAACWRDGDTLAGFEIRIDKPRALLRLTFWGFWRNDLGQRFRDVMLLALRDVSALPAWDALADLREYPAQNAFVQKCHADSMARAKACPSFRRAANIVDTTLSEMQIRRLSEQI
jgi:hypothetical protein